MNFTEQGMFHQIIFEDDKDNSAAADDDGGGGGDGGGEGTIMLVLHISCHWEKKPTIGSLYCTAGSSFKPTV